MHISPKRRRGALISTASITTAWIVIVAVGGAGRAAGGRSLAAETGKPPETIVGKARFEPTAEEATLPEPFRLEKHDFDFTQAPIEDPSKVIRVWNVTFPSPVSTPEPNNNTVHCEYFEPLAPGKHPGVVMLHILGGDFPLSRLFCRSLAHAGVAALFVKMPYYGPRRQPESSARMVSTDPRETRRGMIQAVLDVRQGVAWLGERPEVDARRLGIMGISLGGITAALAASAEPRLENVCLVLAGGGVGEVAWRSPYLSKVRDRWLAEGGTRESYFEALRMVDPVTHASRVRGRRILMLNADHDEIIPRACTEALWRELGEPEIVWWRAGHISAAWYLTQGLALGQILRRITDQERGWRVSVARGAVARLPGQLGEPAHSVRAWVSPRPGGGQTGGNPRFFLVPGDYH